MMLLVLLKLGATNHFLHARGTKKKTTNSLHFGETLSLNPGSKNLVRVPTPYPYSALNGICIARTGDLRIKHNGSEFVNFFWVEE